MRGERAMRGMHCPPFLALMWCALTTAAQAAPIELSSDRLLIRLEPEQGYAVTGLVHRASGTEFIAEDNAEAAGSPWIVQIRDSSGRTHDLTAAHARDASHEQAGNRLTVTWRGVGSEECPADLTVTATARLPADGWKSLWRIEVEGTAPGVIWQVDFPRVFGLRAEGEDQLCAPHYSGRIWRDPTAHPQRYVLNYPMPASMQFLAYWSVPEAREPELAAVEGHALETGWSPDRSDAAGLYWAAEDGQLYQKRFALDTRLATGRLAWWIEHLSELDEWPITPADGPRQVRYALPYDVAIGAFTGDYHEAAQLYLDWARGQDWCSRGAADEWPEATPPAGSDDLVRWVPPWFRDIGFWAKFYHEPAKILPEWAAYRTWLRVPMASHYYRYNVSTFDDNYPEHLPPDPYFIDGIRDARELGVRPLPYINGVIWDTDTQSWQRESGFAAALKNEAGGIYPWDIHGEIYAYMDPAAEQWQANMRETAGGLIVEHGCSGVYLDCLTATASKPSYDPAQPHACHGGSWHAQGNRRLMRDLRAHIRRHDPEACFFSEQIGELVIDLMDGFLTLDQWRSWPLPGMQIAPIFTAVYHPYAINFGCDAQLGQDPDVFAWEMGQMLIWGSQPLNSVVVAPVPQAGDPNSEFLREVVRAYHVIGKRFLQGGRWERIAVVPPGSDPGGGAALALQARPHTVRYEPRRDRRRVWHGPAVMASAWSRQGDVAIVIVNITGEEQPVELTVRPEGLGLAPGARMVRAWPRPPQTRDLPPEGKLALTIPPRRVVIHVLTTDPARAGRGAPLDETAWELVCVRDGELPPVEGPAGSLWACSDGPVLNEVSAEWTRATLQCFTEQGTLERRRGRQAAVRGPQAEGRGLPRDLTDKPFALLRRLPHTVEATGEVTVLSADEAHLSCLAPGGARLEFPRPGLAIVADTAAGRIVRPLSEPATDSLELAKGGPFLVGYAAIEPPGIATIAPAAGDEAREIAAGLVGTVEALVEGAPDTREEALATATRRLHQLQCALGATPGALSPVAPLTRLRRQIQALAVAQVGGAITVTSRHRWLTPGVEKRVALIPWSPSGALEGAGRPTITPVGSWRPGGCVAEMDAAAPPMAAAVTLSDALYVERVVPVVAALPVARDGREYVLTDVLHLEANRPVQIRKPKDVLTAVAGHPARSSVTLRNWSPDEVRMTLAAVGPEGWRVEPESPQVTVPALADQEVAVSVSPPEGARRGAYQARCTANHSGDPEAAVTALIRVALLPSVMPLASPAPAEVAEGDVVRLRRTGKLLVYARQGDGLRLTITNFVTGNYSAASRFVLRGPDAKPLFEGNIPIGESRDIDLAASTTGAHYLEVHSGVGSAEVRTEMPFVSELATPADPLHVFCSRITRYFHVPAGAQGFALGARDGGPTETARLVITAPGGRVALDRNGNFGGEGMAVEVRAGEDGRVWTLRVEPVQDVSVWLEGDVCPYLAASAEVVLTEAGAGGPR